MNVIEDILKDRKNIYFISPHLDDAVLSAGGLIKKLKGKTSITLITVFTQADNPPYSLAAQKNLTLNGFSDAHALYEMRKKEDMRVCQKLKIRFVHLPYKEALFRKKLAKSFFEKKFSHKIAELTSIYPFYKNFLGKGVTTGRIAKDDSLLVRNIKKDLKKLVAPGSVVFCPLGIGNHVDHLIVKKACEETFSELIYWVDFPYVKQELFENEVILKTEKDYQLLSFYGSQMKNIIIDKRTIRNDIFLAGPKSSYRLP